jgi:chromosomal replication initiation ATPase DnaA
MRVGRLIDVVCDRTGVSREELRGDSRERHVADARALVYLLARKHTRLGWRAIARHSTGRDPSGARMAHRALLVRLEEEPLLAADVAAVEQELEQGAPG